MVQNYTTESLAYYRWRSARAKNCARSKYFYLRRKGTGKDEQTDSKGFEINSYNFKNAW